MRGRQTWEERETETGRKSERERERGRKRCDHNIKDRQTFVFCYGVIKEM